MRNNLDPFFVDEEDVSVSTTHYPPAHSSLPSGSGPSRVVIPFLAGTKSQK